ncbi:MAG TPA: WhiB family transcriptional regulator [Ilumatobacter sp.]|nr:WhiB family transcriptional regulator [Ilumatobacter sp.]
MTSPRHLSGYRIGAVDPLAGDPADIVIPADTVARRTLLGRLSPDWHAEALCVGEPTAWFFPTRGESTTAALQLCGRCPVRTQCLNEALAEPGLDYGVRGGMSARARKARRRLERTRGER